MFLKFKIILFLCVLCILCPGYSFSKTFPNNHYMAIVSGKISKKEVKKSGNYYYTEYKLKPEKWLFKKPEIKQTKNLTVKILGADLPKKGLVIKASCAPDFVPFKEKAIFFLEETARKEKDVFTISKNGIIYGSGLKKYEKALRLKRET